MPLVSLSPEPILRFVGNDNLPLVGGMLFTYQAGTNTPAATYTDSTGGTQHQNPIILNPRGEVAYNTGQSAGLWIPADTFYKFVLQDASGNQVWSLDNISDGSATILAALTSDIIAETLNSLKLTTAEQLASVTPTDFSYPPGDFRRYGADPTGGDDSIDAIRASAAQAGQVGGAPMTGPGSFLMSAGLVITSDGVKLLTAGMGATTFLAGADNIDLLKVSSSKCIVGDIAFDPNGHTGVGGLVVAPADESNTASTSQMNYNQFGHIYLQDGLKEGVRLRNGPSVSGADSGLFYNRFAGVYWENCIRSIWLQDAVNNGAGCNRNQFYGVRGGSAGTVCNTGLQIDSGGGNQFFGAFFEGIANGTTPNTIPTAVKIANKSAGGAANEYNQFWGCIGEANTRDLDNSQPLTALFGGFWPVSKWGCGAITSLVNSTTTATCSTATPHGLVTGMSVVMQGQTSSIYSGTFSITVTGANSFTYAMASDPGGSASVVGTYYVAPAICLGTDPSQTPFFLPWAKYTEGASGVPSGYVGINKDIADVGKQFQAYSLTTGNVSGATTIGTASSDFSQESSWVDWSFNITFKVTSATTNILFTAPVEVNALYTVASFNPFYTPTVTGAASTVAVEAGWTSTGALYVKPPTGNWATAGNTNVIAMSVRYRKA